MLLANLTHIDGPLPPSSFLMYVPSTCKNIDNCRTITNIISSCLATIFICIWIGVHPNMPVPKPRGKQQPLDWKKRWNNWWSPVRDRLIISVWALIGPEFILVWAIRQRFVAHHIAKECRSAAMKHARWRVQQPNETQRCQHVAPQGDIELTVAANISNEALINKSGASAQNERGNIEWTTTHGFFILMGGFHLFNDDVPLRPLDRKEVVKRIENGTLTYLPSEDEIEDRSKGDALSKTIVLGQTLWFVAQCIARGIQDITITELEIVTLAYTLIIVLMYGFWWNKPLSVRQPVRVQGEGDPPSVPSFLGKEILGKWSGVFTGIYDRWVTMSDEMKIPTFYAGELGTSELLLTDLIASIVAIFFGVIHSIAWSFRYPSPTEQLLWRISSITVVGGPGIWALYFSFLMVKSKFYVHGRLWWEWVRSTLRLLSFLAIPIYIIARVILLALAFTSLQSLPQAAYQTVTWTTFIPHI